MEALRYEHAMAVNSGSRMLQRCKQAKKCMAIILRLLPQLSPGEWERRCKQLYRTDQVEGPEAIAWGLKLMAEQMPAGAARIRCLNEMDKARNDAAVMRKIRRGWKLFGVDDPWWAVHDNRHAQGWAGGAAKQSERLR